MLDRRDFLKRMALAASTAGATLDSFGRTTTAAEPANAVAKLFDGRSLAGWRGDQKLWSVADGAIVGHNPGGSPQNTFLWSDKNFGDFHLVIDVKLESNDRNAGIQFRSKGAVNHAVGYQADIGRGLWGRIYHEGGRKKLDWTDRAEKAVKPGQWNRCEILAVGHDLWIAVNGRLGAALHDPQGELAGQFAFQIHSGPELTVRYKPVSLVENPRIELAGMTEQQLKQALHEPAVKGKKGK